MKLYDVSLCTPLPTMQSSCITCLEIAAERGRTHTVERLLKGKASIDYRNRVRNLQSSIINCVLCRCYNCTPSLCTVWSNSSLLCLPQWTFWSGSTVTTVECWCQHLWWGMYLYLYCTELWFNGYLWVIHICTQISTTGRGIFSTVVMVASCKCSCSTCQLYTTLHNTQFTIRAC